MKKLYEILGQAPVKGDVGIEIEVEGRNLKHIDDPRWKTTNDGSLRGESFEYVLAAPLPVTKVRSALNTLKEELDAFGSKLSFSFRTSVHVHVNCQELTFKQYLSFLYTYLLLEEPLMTYCGRERKGNRFCLRLQDAEGLLDTLMNLTKYGEGYIREIPVDNIRYAAMNIGATAQYGSLEFRGMRGNLDVDVLMTWVTTLYRLRKYAMTVDSPVAVYDEFVKLGSEGFLRKVIGSLSNKYIYPKMDRDIQRSFSLSIDFPYSYREAKAKEVKPKKVIGKAEEIAQFVKHAQRAGVPPDAINQEAMRMAQLWNVNPADVRAILEEFAGRDMLPAEPLLEGMPMAAPRVVFPRAPVMRRAIEPVLIIEEDIGE